MSCPMCGALATEISRSVQSIRYRCTRYGGRFSLDRDTAAAELARLTGATQEEQVRA